MILNTSRSFGIAGLIAAAGLWASACEKSSPGKGADALDSEDPATKEMAPLDTAGETAPTYESDPGSDEVHADDPVPGARIPTEVGDAGPPQ